MKKSFFDWPLDGQIGLIVCISSLLLVGYAAYVDIRDDDRAEKQGDFIIMKPMRAMWLRMLAMFMFAGLLTYGVSQAGYCINMTAAENTMNQKVGTVFAALVWSAFMWVAYQLLFKRYHFNKTHFVAKNLFCAEKTYAWSQLKNVGIRFGQPHFHFDDGKGFYLPTSSKGAFQLKTLIDAQLFDKDAPVAPIYADDAIGHLSGKRVIIFPYYLDNNCEGHTQSPVVGVFTNVNANEFVVTLDSGERMTAKPNLRGLAFFDDEWPYPGMDEMGARPDFNIHWAVPAPTV